MFNYAQVNAEGCCIGVSSLSGEVLAKDMIPIPTSDSSYIGRFFDGEWSAANPVNLKMVTAPTTEDRLTELKEQNLILMDAIATLFEAITGGAV